MKVPTSCLDYRLAISFSFDAKSLVRQKRSLVATNLNSLPGNLGMTIMHVDNKQSGLLLVLSILKA
jgi:hypothetical protein